MVCHFHYSNFKSTGMDFPSKNMYDTFKDDIWKELGPLDPDWFEALTAEASANEENVSDQDDLCSNQEGNFKAPFDKNAVESQLFSTPKAFRCNKVLSPETEEEQSFTAEQEKETLQWNTTHSPCLFSLRKEGVSCAKYEGIHPQSRDSFDLLHTPQKSPMSSAKQIPESLGAQIHPDISWTSSFNTPPAEPSTLILTKPNESPCPVPVPGDKNVVLVRKLFPSLSNTSRAQVMSPKNNKMPTDHPGMVSPVTVKDPECPVSPHRPLNQSDAVWQQQLPDAVEDGEIHSTIASVLHGAEDVLSIFFTNSSSALRKVKTDRIKRKQIIPRKEHECSLKDVLPADNESIEQKTADQEPRRLFSPPQAKNGDSQWSPLSLSQIAPFTVDTPCHNNSPATHLTNNITTNQLKDGPNLSQVVRPSVGITDSGFSKKKRKFVYPVQSSKLKAEKKERLPENSPAGIADAEQEVVVKHLVQTPGEADRCSIRKEEMQTQESRGENNLPLSVQTKVQDLDMSQLCRDFAQDFSQMANPVKEAEDSPRNAFSPLACLSAMKQAKQKAKQANLHQDSAGLNNINQNPNHSINECTVTDSGFQSAVADTDQTTATSFVLPSTDNNDPSKQCNVILQKAYTIAKPSSAIEEGQTLSLGTERKPHIKSSSIQVPCSAKGTVDSINCTPLNVQVLGNLPGKTTVLPSIDASGFKTASNKGIHISSANLLRAKRLFEEMEVDKTFSDQPANCVNESKGAILMSNGSVMNTTSNSNQTQSSETVSCQLTASQKADVTELCTLLEEAESQFEFTQFQPTKLKQNCEKEAPSSPKIDPDFLMGIDFDDSFSSDYEKHLPVCMTRMHDQKTLVRDSKTNNERSNVAGKSIGLSLSRVMKKEHSSSEDVFKHNSPSSAKPKSPDKTAPAETSKLENRNYLLSNVGFKTARGNDLKVSKKCLSKARALFADIEDNLMEGQPLLVKGSVESEASTQHKPSVVHCSDDLLHVKDANAVFKSTPALTNTATFHRNPSLTEKTLSSLSCTASESVDSSAINELNNGGGSCTAPGQKTFVSADAMKKAELPLTEIHTIEDSNKQLDQKGEPLRAGQLTHQIQQMPLKSGGFQTASGKGVVISSAALQKAKLLLNECVEGGDKVDVRPTSSKMPVPQSRSRNRGFLSASGKPVALSSEALQKAKTLFSDIGSSVDASAVSATRSKDKNQVNTDYTEKTHGGFSTESRNSGFLAASGKPVAFSSEALQKAKDLFKDISSSAETSAFSDTRNNDEKQVRAEHPEKIHCSFSTAGGTKVHVSKKSLLKTKHLMKEFDVGPDSVETAYEADALIKDRDIKDCKDDLSVKHDRSIAAVNGCDTDKENISNCEPLKVTNTPEEPGNECSAYEKGNMGSAVNHENTFHCDDAEIHNGVPKNISDSTCATFSPLMVKTVSSPLFVTSNIGSSASNESNNAGGFSTASGRKVSVSNMALTKAKSLLDESATFNDTCPPQKGGFQTASGKGVVISAAALKKAKTMFNECEGVEDKTAVKSAQMKMPLPVQPTRNCGFLAASGKPVALSSEALNKAKALFSDISLGAEIPPVSSTKARDKKVDNIGTTEKISCGFSTAGGTKVHVSMKNLLKAKTLLKDFADDECHVSNSSSTRQQGTNTCDLSEGKDVKRPPNCNISLANDKDMPAKEITPRVGNTVTSFQENCHDGFLHNTDRPDPQMSSVLDNNINQMSSRDKSTVKRTEESSVLHFESLNLSGCTETQQMFFAQEALDCTKALLEDESVAGLSLPMTLENVQPQENQQSVSGKTQKGNGKRVAEDTDTTGQPPLKRRLLEEFNRTVDGPRGSTLQPEKSNPNGFMKDRRVFKYSTSLHPNVTRPPPRSAKSYLDARLQKTTPTPQSAPGESRSVFVPPFLKNAKTESSRKTTFKDNTRTPPAFVPPFKKQRTVVQEGSSKPQEEDKQHSLFVATSNSNTYVPPSTTTQSTVDVIENKESIQTMPFADKTAKDPRNNQNASVCCQSMDSEASHAEDTSETRDKFQNLENLELARDMQDMRIRKKKRQTIRPLPGSLFLTKTSGVARISLKAAVKGNPPAKYTPKQLYGYGVHHHVCDITSETAEAFRFNLQQFVKHGPFGDGGGVQLADGGWLIPRTDGTAGKEEFYRALCDSPGVDPKLISEEWVNNHYRWIVWKQASMERSFPETMGSTCLTPEQVLLQLKYRYDVEVDHSRRPALRKIMEKDDTAAKTMVLCVCGVYSRGQSLKRQSLSNVKTPQGADAKVENPSAVIWLTDGWYSIKAQMDEPLTAMLHKGRLAVGRKLIIHGAQLVGSQDACSPLEAPESLMLKICANSSRLTRWDVKLGFHKDPRPFLLPVSCLYGNGGPVGCVDIVILRSYPIQWMERKPDGGTVFRSVRAEEKEARRYNNHKQKALEILFAKIQAEFEEDEKGKNKPKSRRRTVTRQDITSLQDGEELYEAVGDDPAYLEAHLSEQQLETLHTYRRSLMEKKQAELQDRYRRAVENAENSEGSCPKRDVTPVWRLCLADSRDQPGRVFQLSIWRPSSDLQSLLKEGCRYKVYNLTTSEGKKQGGNTTVQLTGTKKTQFQNLQASQEWLSTHFQPRVSTHFVELQNPEFQPLCGEVDLSGFVISIIDEQGSSPAFYLADGQLNFVKVRCFSSLAQSGLEDVVKPRVLLALSNLQLRGQSTSPCPVVYAGDLTVFSTNPKEVHLRESLNQLRTLVQGQENFFQATEEKLLQLISTGGLSSNSLPAPQAATPASMAEKGRSLASTTPRPLVRNLGSFTPVGRNPPASDCSTEKNPSSLKRKRALDYLSRIPSPPPLLHLSSEASPCVKKTFNPPRRSGTLSTLTTVQSLPVKPVNPPVEEEWVKDEELAMIDTQAMLAGDLL